ncbi:ABC transporter substrate-binding protein [Lederbergia panacisoli]|uniref:ABC transporter substrate-binding protein n=1 Tax=Lederbergia panacisoli TaxID=1255251 RepID=UPI00214B5D8C|nr:extracellular solute-binding protein [Lederbergia panacisoli]MCR2823679.1 extracellular solute-binding protein [Lederbergia panacisoli]
MKKIAQMLIVLALITGLAACSSSGSSSKGSSKGEDGDIELTFWLWPGMGMDSYIQQYEKDHPNIKIKVQETEYSDHHQNLLTVLAAGSGAPDIAAVESGYIERFKENNQHFYNLLDYGAADIKSDYLDWRWKEASTNDEKVVFGIPTDVGPMAMAYRMDIFEEAGLPTSPDEVSAQMGTWEQYMEAGKKLKAATGKNMFNHVTDLYAAVREQGEKQYFDENGELIIEDSELIKRAWDLSIQGIEIHNNTQRGTTEWSASLAAGDFATVFLPPWMLQNIKNDAPDTAGLWNIALMPGGSGNWGGSLLTLPKQGKHAEEAYKFITWVMSPEIQLEIFKEKGNFPSTPAIYDTDEVQNLKDEFFNRDDLGAIFSEAAKAVKYVYRGPMTGPINTIMGDALISVSDGQATEEEAWKKAMEEVKRQVGR